MSIWPMKTCPLGPAPSAAAASKLYDHQPERQWRHLDTCQYRTILHADPPRSQCPTHGVRVVKLPWAEPSSRFTALFEALAIAWLKAASQKAVGRAVGAELGRDPRHHGARRQARTAASAGRTRPPSGSGREGLPQGPQVHDAWSTIWSAGGCCTWPRTANRRVWTVSGGR